jgi:hypothetical protein
MFLGLAIGQLRLCAEPSEPIRDPLIDMLPRSLQPEFYAAIEARIAARTNRTAAALAPPGARDIGNHLSNPPVYERWPILWKEAFLGRPVDATMMAEMMWLFYAFVVLVVGGFTLAYQLNRGKTDIPSNKPSTTQVFLVFTVVPSIGLLVGVGYRLAGSITRERERRTLESLFALPIERTTILASKWLGAFRRSYRPLLVLGFTITVGMCSGAFHPLSAGLLFLAIGIQAVFVATLALFLSCVSRSTLQANLILFVTLLAILVGTWLGGSSYPGERFEDKPWAMYGFSPLQTVRIVTFGWNDEDPPSPGGLAAVISMGSVVYLGISAMLWWVARFRFRGEPA